MKDLGADDEYVEVDMPPLLKNTLDLKRQLSHLPCSQPHITTSPASPIQSLPVSSLSLVQQFAAQQSVPVLIQILSFVVAVLWVNHQAFSVLASIFPQDSMC